jgi:hypothetical protein
MTSRASHFAAAVIGLAAILTGCAPTSAKPEPTPTFSSEVEAFAAAEATYREYVKALNAVDLSDPETFEGVYAWTTGDANAGARETFSEMHANEWRVAGPTRIVLVEPHPSGQGRGESGVGVAVCLDVSAVTLMDSEGRSVVASDRRDVQSMLVTMSADNGSPTGALISDIDGREGEPLCSE